MPRQLIKTGLACALHWTGADRIVGKLDGARNTPLVIGYHRVVEDFAASAESYMPSMLTSCRMLERHLDWLGRRFRFISLDELGSRLECGEPFEKPAVAITFDDGYADVYYHAFPLLKRKGIPFAVFVVTDLIGTSDLQIYDKLYLLLARAFSTWCPVPIELPRFLHQLGIRLPGMERMRSLDGDPNAAMRLLFTTLPQEEINRVIEALEAVVPIDESGFQELHPLSWDMVSEMHRVGMTIGSHTKTHVLLTNESLPRVSSETTDSRLTLERKLGAQITHFVYPDGQFNAVVVCSVAEAGYRYGYTNCHHRSPHHPWLTIPRKLLWENSCIDTLGRFSSSIMSCHVHGVFDVLLRHDHNHG